MNKKIFKKRSSRISITSEELPVYLYQEFMMVL